MNNKVYCLASAKGGSGKTMIAANVAQFLGGLGKKVLLMDCDAATHGLSLLYIEKLSMNNKEGRQGVFDFIDNSKSISAIANSLVRLENDVDFMPATYKFTSGYDPEENFNPKSLVVLVAYFRNYYDYIFLDAQAGSDKYSRLAMSKAVSDQVIIVSEYDPLSAAGIERLKQVVGEDLEFSRTWILLNKMLPEFIDTFSEFLSIYRYLPPISWNADVVRAYARGKLALDIEQGNIFTLSIKRTLSALLGDDISKEISEWAENRSYILREPLEEQYANAEKELLYTQQLLSRTKDKSQIFRFRLYLLIVGSSAIFATIVFGYGFGRGYFDTLSVDTPLMFSFIGVLGISTALLGSLPFVNRFINFRRNGELDIETSRAKRRVRVLEEKLNQLEALRTANLDTLIQHNQNGHNG